MTATALLLVPSLLSFGGAGREPTNAAATPAKSGVQIDTVRVPMRDGTRLAANVWRPAGAGRWPIILLRSPYPRTCCTIPALASYFVEHGYAVVSQDVRGRGDSEGSFGFWFQEENDGYDSVEWLASAPWSNGRVCMMGPSYVGFTQWLAARAHPPHLVCLAPTSAGGDYFRDQPYMGGAFVEYQALGWVSNMTPRPKGDTARGEIDITSMTTYRPLRSADSALAGRTLPLYQAMLAHATPDDPFWRRISFDSADLAAIPLPVLHVTGWYDWAQGSELTLWHEMRVASPAARDQFLVVGPWTHDAAFFGGADSVGPFALAANNRVDMRAVHLAFFDRYLKRTPAGTDAPRARVYVTGADEWRTYDDYPIRGTTPQRLYLHSGGHADTVDGDGVANWSAPANEPSDHYTFDPTLKAQPWLADPEEDRARRERRQGLALYTSAALNAPTEVIGPVEAEIAFASDARDTDILVSLLDVYPDGRVRVLAAFPGVLRARFRNGLSKPRLLTPGKPEQLRIRLADIAHRFLPGHRIRVEISSCDAPIISLNQNTGNPIATDTAWRTARQTIRHDGDHPSFVTLPVVAGRP